MTPDAIMIFAAGFGTRMGELTRHQPKPLIEVAGKPLIDHALILANDAGISRKIVNTHYFAEMLQDHLKNRPDVVVSHEEPNPLETGGGLKRALPLIGENSVFTLNPDVVWSGSNPLIELAKNWNPDKMDALLMLVPCGEKTGHKGAGDFILNDNNRLSRATENETRAMIYSGAQIIKTAPVAATKEHIFSLNIVWDQLLKNGRMFGCVHSGGWADVGTPAGIPLATTMLESDGNV